MSVVTELNDQKMNASDFSGKSLTLRSVQHFEKDYFPLSSKIGRKGGNSFGVVEISWNLESRVSTRYHFMSEHTIFLVRVRFCRLLEKDRATSTSEGKIRDKKQVSTTDLHQVYTSWRTIPVRGGTRGESYSVRLYDVDQATNISAWVCAYRKDRGEWTNFIRAKAVGFGADEETNTLNLSLERFVSSLDKTSREEALKKCDGMTIDPSFGHVAGHIEVTLRVVNSMFNEYIISRTKSKSDMIVLWGRISLRSSEIKILDDRTLRLTIPPYCLPPPNVDYGSRNLREQVFVRISVDEGSNWTVGRFTYIRNRIPPVRSACFRVSECIVYTQFALSNPQVHRPQIIQYWGTDNTNKFVHENQVSLPLKTTTAKVKSSSTKIEDEDILEETEETNSTTTKNVSEVTRSRSARRVFVNYESVKQSKNSRPDLIFVTDSGEIFRVKAISDSTPEIKHEDLENLITQGYEEDVLGEDENESASPSSSNANDLLESKRWYPNPNVMDSAFTEVSFLQQRCIQAFVEAIHPNTRYGNGIYLGKDVKSFDKMFPSVKMENFFTDIYQTPLPQVYIGKNMNAQLRNLIAWRLDCSGLHIYRNTQHQILWHRGSFSKSKNKKKHKGRSENKNEEPVTPEHQVLLQMSPDESPCVEDIDPRDLLFVTVDIDPDNTRRHSHSTLKKKEKAMRKNLSGAFKRKLSGSFMKLSNHEKDHNKSHHEQDSSNSHFSISIFRCVEELNNERTSRNSKVKFTPVERLSEEEKEQLNLYDREDHVRSPASKMFETSEEQSSDVIFTKNFLKRCEHVWSKAIRCVQNKNKDTRGNRTLKKAMKEIRHEIDTLKDKMVDEEMFLRILETYFEQSTSEDDYEEEEEEKKTDTDDDDNSFDDRIDLDSITVDALLDSNLRQFLLQRLQYAEDKSVLKHVMSRYEDIWFKAETVDALGLSFEDTNNDYLHSMHHVFIESHSARYPRGLVLGHLVLKENDATSTVQIQRMKMWGPVASHSLELKMIQFASQFAEQRGKTLESKNRLRGDATKIWDYFTRQIKTLTNVNYARLHRGNFVEKIHAILRVNDEVMSQVQDYSDTLKRKQVKSNFIIEAIENYKAEIALGLRVSTRCVVSAEFHYGTTVGSGSRNRKIVQLETPLQDIDLCMTIAELKSMILNRMEKDHSLPKGKNAEKMIEDAKEELNQYNEGLDVRIVMNYKISNRASTSGYQESRSKSDIGNEAKFYAQEFPPFDESRTINYYFGHMINRRIRTRDARSDEYNTGSLQTSQSGQDDDIVVNVQLDIVPKVHRVRSEWGSIVAFAKKNAPNIVRSSEIVLDERTKNEELAFANLWVDDIIPNVAMIIEHMEEFWFYRSVRSSIRQESQFILSENVRSRLLGVNQRNGVGGAGELEMDRPFQDGSRSMVEQIRVEWQRRKSQGRDELVNMDAGESFQVYVRRPHQRRCVESDCPRAPMVMCNKCSIRAGMPQMWCAYHMFIDTSRHTTRSLGNRERSVWVDSHCSKCDETYVLYTVPDMADVYCIGDNTDGQCGSRDVTTKKQLVKIPTTKWKDTRNIIMTSCGPGYTVAVANNSQGIVQIFAWGKGGGGCPQGKKGCKEPKPFMKFRYDQAGVFRVETFCSSRVLQYIASEASKYDVNTNDLIKDKACHEREVRSGRRWASKSRSRFDAATQVASALTKELKTQYLIMAGRLYDVWNSKSRSGETVMIKLTGPNIVYERENSNLPSSILRGKFERIVLPLNFRQMHLCDVPYARASAFNDNSSSEIDKAKKKQGLTTRWRLVLQSDFEWLGSFSKNSSSSTSRSQDQSIAQGVPANSVLLRSFEELRGGEWLNRSILRRGRRQCGTGVDSLNWRRGIEWVYRRLCHAWKTRTENSVFLHYVKKAHRNQASDELVGQHCRDTVGALFSPVEGEPGMFPALYLDMNLPTFKSGIKHVGVVHIIVIEEDFTLYRNVQGRVPLYQHAVEVLERYATWPLSLEFALPPPRTNSHKVESRIVRSANDVPSVERHVYTENPCRVDILQVEHEMERSMRRLVEERRAKMKMLMIEVRRELREKSERRAAISSSSSSSPSADFSDSSSSTKEEKMDRNKKTGGGGSTGKRNPDDDIAILSMRMDAERLKIESLEKLQKVWWDVDEMKFQTDRNQNNNNGHESSMTDFEGALKLSNRMIGSANALHNHENFQECVSLSGIISERSLASGEILLDCVNRKRKIRASLKKIRGGGGSVVETQALTNTRKLLDIVQDSASMQARLDEDFLCSSSL